MSAGDDKNIHDQLSEEMGKAWDLYHAPMEIPEPDFSFLENKEPKRKRSFFKVTLKVASVLLAIFVVSSGVGIWFNSDNSYGVKSYIQNFKHFLSPENQPTMDEDGMSTMNIKDWKDLDMAKNVVQKLYYPSYIPERFTFKNLEVGSSKDFISLIYDYKEKVSNNNFQVSIACFQDNGDTYLRGREYTSPKSGKKMLIDYDKAFKTYCATYVEDGYIFNADGAATREEAIKIVEGIRLKK